MIELDSTWNTVVMLLVAAGVGLIGGIGGAFIEWRQRCAAPVTSGAGSCNSRLSALSCIVLGGLAAVAILYFFPPTQEVVEPATDGAEPVVTTFYDLTQLVALALIVGSAGAAFLQALQTRALAMAKAQEAEATKATATAAVSGIGARMEQTTEDTIKDASTQIKAELQKATPLPLEQAEKIVDDLADKASTAVAESLESEVKTAQRVIAATGTGEPTVPAPATGNR